MEVLGQLTGEQWGIVGWLIVCAAVLLCVALGGAIEQWVRPRPEGPAEPYPMQPPTGAFEASSPLGSEFWKGEAAHYRDLYMSAVSSREALRDLQETPGAVPISLTHEQAEGIIGRKLPAELFQFVPLGHNIVVVREKPKTMQGKIHIPARSQSARAVGWVVAVGPDVGKGIVNWISRWPWPREQLLGTKVVFGAYAGIALLMDSDSTLDEWVEEAGGVGSVNDDYLSPFKLMTDNSFLGILRETPKVPSPVEVWANSVQTSEKEKEEWQQQASGPAPSPASTSAEEPGSASTEATGTEPEPSANRFAS